MKSKINAKDIFLFVNLGLALFLWFGDCVYVRYSNLWIKSVTSLLFVIVGVVNLVYATLSKPETRKLKFPILMLTGLVFAMLGDVILEVEFIVGASLFAVGHVFYFVSYIFLEKFKPTDLIYGLCIFVPAVLLITLAPIFDFGDVVMEVVVVVYAAVISCMVGKAIANFVRAKNKTNLIILIGSLLFFISDFTLLFNVFSTLPYFGVICLATYYPAQFLLGFSVFSYCSANRAADSPTAETAPEADTANVVTDNQEI
ncbi:MAG: lysoplasmalogenase [Clostridiales bacterium]|nr:lysoplasmalogenase [Clostridiales bacterium]